MQHAAAMHRRQLRSTAAAKLHTERYQANLNACVLMEPQPETATATVRVCGHDIQTTAEELELAGLQVKDPADFTALSQVVNLRTITLSKMTFADADWDGSLANIKACRHLTHLNLTACGLGPKHAADLAGIFSSGG